METQTHTKNTEVILPQVSLTLNPSEREVPFSQKEMDKQVKFDFGPYKLDKE